METTLIIFTLMAAGLTAGLALWLLRAQPLPPLAAGAVLLMLPIAGGGLYLLLGDVGRADYPLARRADLSSANLPQPLRELYTALQTTPDDAGGWALYGQGNAMLGRYAAAAAAFDRARQLAPTVPELHFAYGQSLYRLAGGVLSDQAIRALRRTLSLAPEHAGAKALLADVVPSR